MTEFQKPNQDAQSRPFESSEGMNDRDYGGNLIGFGGPMSTGTGRIIAIGLEASDKRLFFDPAIRLLTRGHDSIYPFFVGAREVLNAHLFAVAWDIGVSNIERIFGRAFSSLDGFRGSPLGKSDELKETEKLARGYAAALSYMKQWTGHSSSLIRLGESKERWLIETDGGVFNYNYSRHADVAELGPLEFAGLFVAALSTRESKSQTYGIRAIPHTALSVRRTLPGEIDRLMFLLGEGGSDGLAILKREAETLAPARSPAAAARYLAYLFLAHERDQELLQRDASPWKLAAVRESIGMMTEPIPYCPLGIKGFACTIKQARLLEDMLTFARMGGLISAEERKTIASLDKIYSQDSPVII